MEKELMCRDCNMMFHSARMLHKHKVLLCIGRKAGQLQVQRHTSEPVRRTPAGGMDPKQTRTSDLVQLRDQQRNVDAEPKSPRVEDKPARDDAALQNLTEEFHKLRMSIEENLPKWSKRTRSSEVDSTVSRSHLGHSERLKEMREITSVHEHQLALIHVEKQQLEQQRDELLHQINILPEQNNTTHMEKLLMENRKEETLQRRSRHLYALRSVPAAHSESHNNKKMHHDNYVDAPLSSQIKALQQEYMQSGGSDPTIITELMELQAEAQSQEKDQPAAASTARKKSHDEKVSHPSWELLVLEQENQRLEEEILRMQLIRERLCDSGAAALKMELELIQRENLHRISSIQAEMERRKEGFRPRRRPPPAPLPLQPDNHIHAPLPLVQLQTRSSSSDRLGSAPYDPAAGFVVFYDVMLGLDASLKILHLVSALYSKGQEVGESTLLPAVQVLPGVPCSDPLSLTPGNHVLLSVKQHVSRIQPSPFLCLVVELQAAGSLDDHNHEAFKPTSCGWTRLELFDQFNQLLSGHWRAPLRSLPVRPSGSIAQLNSILQVGSTELCVRLVNGRDADLQTLLKPDPLSIRHYKYPPVGR